MPVPRSGSRTFARPISLVTALDESGSTACSDPNEQRHQALLELCEWMTRHSGDPRDRIGVVRFADRAETVPAVVVTKALATLRDQLLVANDVGGGTQLTPAVDALCTALPQRGSRRVAVLVTDGQVAEGNDELRHLFARLHAHADAVHLVALDHDGLWTRSTQQRYAQLGLAGTTVIGAVSRAQLAHALATLLMDEAGLVARRGWRRRA